MITQIANWMRRKASKYISQGIPGQAERFLNSYPTWTWHLLWGASDMSSVVPLCSEAAFVDWLNLETPFFFHFHFFSLPLDSFCFLKFFVEGLVVVKLWVKIPFSWIFVFWKNIYIYLWNIKTNTKRQSWKTSKPKPTVPEFGVA